MKKDQNFKWDTLNLGTCYYPEHWDRLLWEDDMKRMLDAGIQSVPFEILIFSHIVPLRI